MSSKHLKQRSALRRAVSWTFHRLPTSPDPAGVGVARACVVFPPGVLFCYTISNVSTTQSVVLTADVFLEVKSKVS